MWCGAADQPVSFPPDEEPRSLARSRRTTVASSKPSEAKAAKTASSSSDVDSSEADADVKIGRKTGGRRGNKTTTSTTVSHRCHVFVLCYLGSDLAGGKRKKSHRIRSESILSAVLVAAAATSCHRVLNVFQWTCMLVGNLIETASPSNSIWPHLSYTLVRSKREYYHNCSLVVLLCSLCNCTVIWAAHRFGLPDLASSHWFHSLSLGYFVCVRLFSCVISACML